MAYKVIASQKFQKELDKAVGYYYEHSKSVAAKFLATVHDVYNKISINPFYQVRYKNIRSIPVKGFPYLYFLLLMK